MSIIRNAILAVTAAAAGLVAAAPANAVITPFASFNASSAGNIVWRNNGTVPGNPLNPNTTYTFNGTGGTLFTTSSAANVAPRNAVAGGVGATFTFLNALNPWVANVPAIFTLSATTTGSAAQTFGPLKLQSVMTGSFSFISTGPITINNVVYTNPKNLLSATFQNLDIFGQSGGTSGTFGGSVANGATIEFTSDFVNFPGSIDRDVSLSLSSILSLNNNVNVGLNNTANRALRSFRATATGSFSADPTPGIIPSIPEPETWAMFVVGFGMVAINLRRRKKTVAAG